MRQGKAFSRFFMAAVLTGGLTGAHGVGWAQEKSVTVPDAQIEANVLKALAGAPQLADQSISTTTVYGTVTISGTVRDEASRDMAEHLVSNAPGVKKVVDELTIGTGTAPANDTPQQSQEQDSTQEGTNPNLQSDGTMAPPPSTQPAQEPYSGKDGNVAASPQDSNAPQNGQQPVYSRRNPYGPPPSAPPSSTYNQQPRAAQQGGEPVVVPSGTTLRVRVNQGMNSKNTAPGTPFDGVVLSDVVAGGSVAIPRGAAVQGVVADVRNAGQFKGQGALMLKLTTLTLGGQTYPLTSDFWSHQGADKTGNTVGNTVGLSAVGAVIGAIAGGGVGAAVGAGVGGVAGLGVSSASNRGEAMIPAEAIVSFRLTQPAELTTVSQAELNRLGSGLPNVTQPQMRRRYPPPPPPPYYPYYGPAYYYPRY
jgi:hypothetical protein